MKSTGARTHGDSSSKASSVSAGKAIVISVIVLGEGPHTCSRLKLCHSNQRKFKLVQFHACSVIMSHDVDDWRKIPCCVPTPYSATAQHCIPTSLDDDSTGSTIMTHAHDDSCTRCKCSQNKRCNLIVNRHKL